MVVPDSALIKLAALPLAGMAVAAGMVADVLVGSFARAALPAPWVAAASAAEPAPVPRESLAGTEPAQPAEKPAPPVAEPRQERSRPTVLKIVVVVQHPPPVLREVNYPSVIPNLLAYLERLPQLELPARGELLPLGAPGIRDAALLILPEQPQFELGEAELRALGECLKAGGLLFADVAYPEGAFERQLKAYLRDPLVLGSDGQSWQRVPRDHSLYSCYFAFPHGPPRRGGGSESDLDEMEMLLRRERLVVLLSRLHITWYWTDEFGSRRYEEVLRFGVNLLVYAWSLQMSR